MDSESGSVDLGLFSVDGTSNAGVDVDTVGWVVAVALTTTGDAVVENGIRVSGEYGSADVELGGMACVGVCVDFAVTSVFFLYFGTRIFIIYVGSYN